MLEIVDIFIIFSNFTYSFVCVLSVIIENVYKKQQFNILENSYFYWINYSILYGSFIVSITKILPFSFNIYWKLIN